MNVESWIAIGTAAVTVIGWFIRLERRLGSHLTRTEHEKICRDRDDRVEKQIGDLRHDQDRRHEENRQTLGEIRDSINGTHRRLDEFLLHRRGSS